jgi:uncharacterized protein YcbX
MAARVAALNLTPVKGLRIARHAHVELERGGGVRGDRRFYIVDERGRMVNGKSLGGLHRVLARLLDGDRLSLEFPDGSTVEADVELGEMLETSFFSRPRPALVLAGPFAAALSDHLGVAVRVVAPGDGDSAVDRGAPAGVTLVSAASVAALARVAGEAALDARRFRMSIVLEGVAELAEDGWVGREVRVGEARLAFNGHVGRCLVTSRDPESGEIDVPTLDHLRDLRGGEAQTTEPLALGIYGAVLRSGGVSVGDPVEPL